MNLSLVFSCMLKKLWKTCEKPRKKVEKSRNIVKKGWKSGGKVCYSKNTEENMMLKRKEGDQMLSSQNPPSAMSVAAEIITQYQNHKREITNLKLQKVLYYVQIYHLQKYGTVAFADDIEAWRLGPVVRDVYRSFRRYASSPISSEDPALKESKHNFSSERLSGIDEIAKKTLDLDVWQIVAKTHATKPWSDCYVRGEGRVIPVEKLKKEGTINL